MKLYVFLVNTGTTLTFDTELAVQNVSDLKHAIQTKYKIAIQHQVLVVNGGECMAADRRVCSYSAGTDTNPIFLFNKEMILCERPPAIPKTTFSAENEMELKVEESLMMPAVFHTVASRTQLAVEMYEVAKKLCSFCEGLVHDEHLQHQGWAAIMANLEDCTYSYQKLLFKFENAYSNYLQSIDEIKLKLTHLGTAVSIMAKIPLLECLTRHSYKECLGRLDSSVGNGGAESEETEDEKSAELVLFSDIPRVNNKSLLASFCKSVEHSALDSTDPGNVKENKESSQNTAVEDNKTSEELNESDLPSFNVSLLDWINVQDRPNDVESLVRKCFDSMSRLDPRIIQPFLVECRQTIAKLDNQNMKAIKGLEDRLYALDQMIASCSRLVNEQKELAQKSHVVVRCSICCSFPVRTSTGTVGGDSGDAPASCHGLVGTGISSQGASPDPGGGVVPLQGPSTPEAFAASRALMGMPTPPSPPRLRGPGIASRGKPALGYPGGWQRERSPPRRSGRGSDSSPPSSDHGSLSPSAPRRQGRSRDAGKRHHSSASEGSRSRDSRRRSPDYASAPRERSERRSSVRSPTRGRHRSRGRSRSSRRSTPRDTRHRSRSRHRSASRRSRHRSHSPASRYRSRSPERSRHRSPSPGSIPTRSPVRVPVAESESRHRSRSPVHTPRSPQTNREARRETPSPVGTVAQSAPAPADTRRGSTSPTHSRVRAPAPDHAAPTVTAPHTREPTPRHRSRSPPHKRHAKLKAHRRHSSSSSSRSPPRRRHHYRREDSASRSTSRERGDRSRGSRRHHTHGSLTQPVSSYAAPGPAPQGSYPAPGAVPAWPQGPWQWPYWQWAPQPTQGTGSVPSMGPHPPPPLQSQGVEEDSSEGESDPLEGPSTGPIPQSSSSSPAEATARDRGTPLPDFKTHQELLKRLAENLKLDIKELVEEEDPLFGAVGPAGPTRMALPVHESVLKLVKPLWETPASVAPTSKTAERKYYVPLQGFEYLFNHPAPGSLVVDAVNQRDRQGTHANTPKNKESKKLDLFGRKIYSTAALQLRMANYQALLGRYTLNLWSSLQRFLPGLPQDMLADFNTLVQEGSLVANAALQSASDATDAAGRAMASGIVMRRASWLQSSGLSPEVQQAIQDLPFTGSGLFSDRTDEKLHALKDSRATLKSLGLYVPQAARRQGRPRPPRQQHQQAPPRPPPRPPQSRRGRDRFRQGNRRDRQGPAGGSQQGPQKGAKRQWCCFVMLHADQDGEKLQALLRLVTELLERVKIVEALSTVPQMYCLAVVEVVRRKMFIKHYREWAGALIKDGKHLYEAEKAKRESFGKLFSKFFLRNRLFRGLESWPPSFCTRKPRRFDSELPDISLTDLQFLQSFCPSEVQPLLRVPILCDFEPLHQHVLALHNLVKAAQSLDEMSQTITDLLNEQKVSNSQASPQSATTPRMESTKGTTIATSSRTPPSLSLQGPLCPPVCPPAALDELSPDSIDAHTFDFETITHPNLEQALKQGSLDLDSLAESPESDFMSAVNEFVIEENASSPNIISDPQSPEMMVESLYSSVINAIDNRRMQDTNICVKEESLNVRMEKCRVVAQESQFNLRNIKEDLCHFRTFVQKEQCDFSNSLKCTSVEIRNIIQKVKLSLEKTLKDKHQKELQSLKNEYETRINTLLEDVEENKKKIKKLKGDLIGLEEVLQNKDNEFAMVKNEKEVVVCLQYEKDQKLLALEGQMKTQNCEIKELRQSREVVLEDLKKLHIESDEKIQLLRVEFQSLEESHLKELENNLQIRHTQEFDKLIAEHKDCLDKLKKENQQRFEQMHESQAAVVQEREQHIEELKLKISDLLDLRCKLEVELALKEAETEEMKILLEESRTQQQEILKSLIDKETENLRKELDKLNHQIQVNNDEYQVGLVELRILMTIEKDQCISELVNRHEEETNVLKIELNKVTSLHQKALEVEKSLKEQIIELRSKLEVEVNALKKQKEEKLVLCEQKDTFEAIIHNLEEEKELLITNQEQDRKLLVQKLSSEKEDAIQIIRKESELQREAVEKELLEKIQLLEMQVNQSPPIELSAASSLVAELQEKLEEEKMKFLEQLEEQEKRKNEEMQNFRMSLTAEQQTNFNTVLTREKMKKENIINDLSDKLKTITQQQERDKDLIETLSEDRARLLEEKKKLEEVNKMRSSNFISSAYLPIASESCGACAPDLPDETERVASEITDEGRLDSAMDSSMMAVHENIHMLSEEKQRIMLLERTLQLKEEENKRLNQRLMSQSMSSVSSRHSEKIAIRDFQVGDLVLIILDERHDNYVLFTVSPTLYFLHSESLAALDLKPASGASRRPWVLGKVMEKEYCQAKKAQNRFKVPLGTKFYRVKAVPWNKKV
ncbi:RB1-inducible coiled-coil protein 1 [Emydura macquarii macquarii]